MRFFGNATETKGVLGFRPFLRTVWEVSSHIDTVLFLLSLISQNGPTLGRVVSVWTGSLNHPVRVPVDARRFDVLSTTPVSQRTFRGNMERRSFTETFRFFVWSVDSSIDCSQIRSVTERTCRPRPRTL